LRPVNKRLREKYRERLNGYLVRAERSSLAELAASIPLDGENVLGDQVTQWLFAFDAGGITVFRTLALLAGRAEYCSDSSQYLRALFLDTQRLEQKPSKLPC
jgi:hypothetical protein